MIPRFFRLAQLARPYVESQMQDKRAPPTTLPPKIVKVFMGAMDQEDSSAIEALWSTFRYSIWGVLSAISVWKSGLVTGKRPPQKTAVCGLFAVWSGLLTSGEKADRLRLRAIEAKEEDITIYNKFSLTLGTLYRNLYPPVRSCQDAFCVNRREVDSDILTLGEPVTHQATLFTLTSGALPIYTTSLYCRKCKRRYHHNYIVHNSSNTRTYYGDVPDVIQVAQHFFIESSLLEFFANTKVFGWLSSSNCARIYNTSLRVPHAHILNNKLAFQSNYHRYEKANVDWQTSLSLQDVDVLNGFFLYSLLLEKAERRTILQLPHNESSQKDRLAPALQERNHLIEGIGQEQYPHACNLCFIVFKDKSGKLMKMQAAVCDGDTIGHPCCAVHDCKDTLVNHRNCFCAQHNHLNFQCAVVDCVTASEVSFKTCTDPEHRVLEEAYFRRGKAIFQLRAKLKKAGAIPVNSILLDLDTGEGDDELIMRPCGIILSRVTFFGSEAISAVNTFVKATFPTPESTPKYFIFDNNCKLVAHQRVIGDKHFKDTAMPVDVFHFNTKHKESDLHCQTHCNPAAFPELIDANNKWKFNTSICEQTNVWLGGYQAILRDMEVTRFNFYLDEMIKHRNRYTISQLHSKGHHPWHVPVKAWFPDC
ncbi:uncharacterized protein LACBIDRAFT_331992 [Laccaria bicolor S238N-H82]|uniref:Predicted protein n=1 Tax=Laccaria bicolor (strain S238N-H82 / ATCC MYA-4686) TaxID=486041 RepID=B0DQY3_LACBS|nr:uncharacterized protein LACBIDRAFT_331992 [Laccaria bicolor S238N-H82]EDR03022.1 predicted protein [Laccaria bicolor S238N-H82]|eukprot:XP_001886445.1 predicted protein [Laccaria bicolor S238N-H82]